MSEQDKKKQEKNNTNAWMLKQAQKKQQVGGQADKKQKKKEKPIKKDKDNKKQQQEPKKIENLHLQQEKKQTQTIMKQQKKVKRIEEEIYQKNQELYENQEFQEKLLLKSIAQLLREDNTVLHINCRETKYKNHLTLEKFIQCQFIHIPQFTSPSYDKAAEIVCRYQDIGFLFENSVQKIIIEPYTIFSNGSALVQKGTLNIVILAKYFKVPIVLGCGSWKYCGQAPSNEDQIERVYGRTLLEKYDWVPSDMINLIVLESGPLLPSQLSYNVMSGYRNYGIKGVAW